MRRRDLLAGIASAGVVAGGAGLAVFGRPSLDDDTEPEEPVELETVEAAGSTDGTVMIPNLDADRVRFLDFFATWCAPCKEQMPAIAEARDRTEADFVSVTNEPIGRTVSEGELREWWADHDGGWTVALDPTGELSERYEVSGYPTAVVLDREGVVDWSHSGILSADGIVNRIEAAE
ncbi:TlpA family protein disulfide reductase [Saliphagus infecundisoli]|uniref:TlpA family protein disulfide reductase n=1 Tax=Saliphagus infecundisoli TaxID=1849069 RepID=A0ABD5QCM0_9EURY|nr:TlpA disulfide reductase family protein [Saliphagus infecundisoli]